MWSKLWWFEPQNQQVTKAVKQDNQNNKNKRQQLGDEVECWWRTSPKEKKKLRGWLTCTPNKAIYYKIKTSQSRNFVT